MNRIKSAAKTLAINVAIILTVIGVLVTGPLAVFGAYDTFRIIFPALSTDSKIDLPNYDRID